MIQFDKQAIVKKYLGIPYKHLGRGMDGLDCWGLIVRIYADKGVEVFDLQEYEKEWARRGQNIIVDNYYENWQKVRSMELGDVMLLHYPRPESPVSHAGLYLGNNRFIQASFNGVIVSTMEEWRSRVYGAFRYLNLKG